VLTCETKIFLLIAFYLSQSEFLPKIGLGRHSEADENAWQENRGLLKPDVAFKHRLNFQIQSFFQIIFFFK